MTKRQAWFPAFAAGLIVFGLAATSVQARVGTPASVAAEHQPCPPKATGQGKYGKYGVVRAKHDARIFYNAHHVKNLRKEAKKLRTELDTTIWPMENDLMRGGKPLGYTLDICLVQNTSDALGETMGATVPIGQHGSVVLLPRFYQGVPLSAIDLRDSLSHEFFHVMQNTLAARTSRPEYAWWRDSTATWAIQYVYPHDNLEQTSKFDLNFPRHYFESIVNGRSSIDAQSGLAAYGTYVFPWYLAQKNSPKMIARIWHAAETESVDSAIHDVLGTRLRRVWPDFMAQNWGKAPFDQYKTWDPPFDHGVSKVIQPIALPAVSVVAPPDLALPHLSGALFSYDIPADARTVAFANMPPFGGDSTYASEFDPDAQVWAIVSSGGQDDVQKLTGQPGLFWCDAIRGKHVDHVTLIFSNSKATEDLPEPPEVAPQLIVSKDGCASWQGSIDAKRITGGLVETSHADVTFKPLNSAADDSGGLYSATGTIHWSISGTNDAGCSVTGEEVEGLTAGESVLQLGWNTVGMRPDAYAGDIDDVVAGRQETVTVNCGGSKSDESWQAVPAWNSVGDKAGAATLVGGTTMSGSSGYSGTNSTSTWNWNLTSTG